MPLKFILTLQSEKVIQKLRLKILHELKALHDTRCLVSMNRQI